MNKLSRDYINEFAYLGTLSLYLKDNSNEVFLDDIEILPSYNQRYSCNDFSADNIIEPGDKRYELMLEFDNEIVNINKIIDKILKTKRKTEDYNLLIEILIRSLNDLIEKYLD